MNYREYKRMALSRDADPATVERGVLAIRSEMIDTLSRLEDRLSPRRVFDQIMQRGRTAGEGSSQFVHNLGELVRDNPVSVVLFVGGAASLLNAERRIARPRLPAGEEGEHVEGLAERAQHGIGERAQGVRQRAHDMRERAQDMRQRARDAGERAQARRAELQDRARERFRSARDLGRKSLGDARSRGERIVHEEPLLLAGLGLALGAIAGARVRMSEREQRVFESARRPAPSVREGESPVDTAAGRAVSAVEREEAAVSRRAQRAIDVEGRVEISEGPLPADPNPGPPTTGGR